MPNDIPGQVPSYEGRNKYGEGAKDKLENPDHAASDGDINVQGDDHPQNHPGAAHEESAPHVEGDHSTNYMPDSGESDKDKDKEEEEPAPVAHHTTTSEHDAPPTLPVV